MTMQTLAILGALLSSSGTASALEVSRPCTPLATDGDVVLVGQRDEAGAIRRLPSGTIFFTDGRERVATEIGGLVRNLCDTEALAAVLVPERALRPHTRYWMVDRLGSTPFAGLGPFSVADGVPPRPQWRDIPRPIAESIIAGTRTVVIAVPGIGRGLVAVTRVHADGTMALTENRPVFNEVTTVDVGGDVREVIVRVVGPSLSMPLRVAIPPAGQIRSASAAPRVTVSECAPWSPSVPAGLLLFGVVPFLLSYGFVRSLGRRA